MGGNTLVVIWLKGKSRVYMIYMYLMGCWFYCFPLDTFIISMIGFNDYWQALLRFHIVLLQISFFGLLKQVKKEAIAF